MDMLHRRNMIFLGRGWRKWLAFRECVGLKDMVGDGAGMVSGGAGQEGAGAGKTGFGHDLNDGHDYFG